MPVCLVKHQSSGRETLSVCEQKERGREGGGVLHYDMVKAF